MHGAHNMHSDAGAKTVVFRDACSPSRGPKPAHYGAVTCLLNPSDGY